MPASKVSVRIVLEKDAEADFADILEDRKSGDKTLTAGRLIYSWLSDNARDADKSYRQIVRDKVTDVGGPTKLTPEAVVNLPDGSWEGTEGYLVAIGERLLPLLQRAAALSYAGFKARTGRVPPWGADLQAFAIQIVKETIDTEATKLAEKDMAAEAGEMFAPPKDEKPASA